MSGSHAIVRETRTARLCHGDCNVRAWSRGSNNFYYNDDIAVGIGWDTKNKKSKPKTNTASISSKLLITEKVNSITSLMRSNRPGIV